MWALPDIQSMNVQAAMRASSFWEARIAAEENEDGSPATCLYGEWNGDQGCVGDLFPHLWYDIFSDDPKGLLWLCDYHEGYSGQPVEGYFTCDDCERVMIENYTWERYEHVTEDGESLCLNCYAKRVIEDPSSWLELDGDWADRLNMGLLRYAPHIMAHSGPTHGLDFHGNAEFDSMDGHAISGGGLDGLREKIATLESTGISRVLLVLDAAYQFAVSIGIYTDMNAELRPAPADFPHEAFDGQGLGDES